MNRCYSACVVAFFFCLSSDGHGATWGGKSPDVHALSRTPQTQSHWVGDAVLTPQTQPHMRQTGQQSLYDQMNVSRQLFPDDDPIADHRPTKDDRTDDLHQSSPRFWTRTWQYVTSPKHSKTLPQKNQYKDHDQDQYKVTTGDPGVTTTGTPKRASARIPKVFKAVMMLCAVGGCTYVPWDGILSPPLYANALYDSPDSYANATQPCHSTGTYACPTWNLPLPNMLSAGDHQITLYAAHPESRRFITQVLLNKMATLSTEKYALFPDDHSHGWAQCEGVLGHSIEAGWQLTEIACLGHHEKQAASTLFVWPTSVPPTNETTRPKNVRWSLFPGRKIWGEKLSYILSTKRLKPIPTPHEPAVAYMPDLQEATNYHGAEREMIAQASQDIPLGQALTTAAMNTSAFLTAVVGETVRMRQSNKTFVCGPAFTETLHNIMTGILLKNGWRLHGPMVCDGYVTRTWEAGSAQLYQLSCRAVDQAPTYRLVAQNGCVSYIKGPMGRGNMRIIMAPGAETDSMGPLKFMSWKYYQTPLTLPPAPTNAPTPMPTPAPMIKTITRPVHTATVTPPQTPTAAQSQIPRATSSGSVSASASASMARPIPVVDLRTALGNETLYDRLLSCREKLKPYYTYDGFWSATNNTARVHGTCPTGVYPFMNQTWANTTNFIFYDRSVVPGSIPADQPWAGAPLPSTGSPIILRPNASRIFSDLAPAAQFSVLDQFLNVSLPEGSVNAVSEMAEAFDDVCADIKNYQISGWENENAFNSLTNTLVVRYICGRMVEQ